MLDQEILDGFKEETKGLLEELTEVVESLEQPSKEFPAQLMSDFSQKIDRVMGAAKTIAMMDPSMQELKQIGAIAEICKRLGYKAAEVKNAALVPYFAAFWADTLETIDGIVDGLGGASPAKQTSFAAHLQKRLEWLNSRLAPEAGTQKVSQLDIDALLKDLG